MSEQLLAVHCDVPSTGSPETALFRHWTVFRQQIQALELQEIGHCMAIGLQRQTAAAWSKEENLYKAEQKKIEKHR